MNFIFKRMFTSVKFSFTNFLVTISPLSMLKLCELTLICFPAFVYFHYHNLLIFFWFHFFFNLRHLVSLCPTREWSEWSVLSLKSPFTQIWLNTKFLENFFIFVMRVYPQTVRRFLVIALWDEHLILLCFWLFFLDDYDR